MCGCPERAFPITARSVAGWGFGAKPLIYSFFIRKLHFREIFADSWDEHWKYRKVWFFLIVCTADCVHGWLCARLVFLALWLVSPVLYPILENDCDTEGISTRRWCCRQREANIRSFRHKTFCHSCAGRPWGWTTQTQDSCAFYLQWSK